MIASNETLAQSLEALTRTTGFRKGFYHQVLLEAAERLRAFEVTLADEVVSRAKERAETIPSEAMNSEFLLMAAEILRIAAIVARSSADAIEYGGANAQFGKQAEEATALLSKASDKLACMVGFSFEARDTAQRH